MLTGEEADARPAGKGHEPPEPTPEPQFVLTCVTIHHAYLQTSGNIVCVVHESIEVPQTERVGWTEVEVIVLLHHTAHCSVLRTVLVHDTGNGDSENYRVILGWL